METHPYAPATNTFSITTKHTRTYWWILYQWRHGRESGLWKAISLPQIDSDRQNPSLVRSLTLIWEKRDFEDVFIEWWPNSNRGNKREKEMKKPMPIVQYVLCDDKRYGFISQMRRRYLRLTLSLWPSSSPPVNCGVLVIRECSGPLVNWFSNKPSLKVAKLPACYAEIFLAKSCGPCYSILILPYLH